MKKLYFTVTKKLQNIDGVEETTGFKVINLYDIVDNKPLLVAEIEAENEYSTIDELNHFVNYTLTDEEYISHLNKQDTFLFEQL